MDGRPTICLGLLLLLVSSASEAAGRTWWVKKDGSGDATVIQEAVDAAAAGDTIRIGPGRFEEYRPFTTPYWTENVYVLISTDDLTLIGSGADATIIGPPQVIYGYGEYPYGLLTKLDAVESLRVRNLRMENNRYNLVGECHYLEVDSCTFSGGGLGLMTTADLGSRIRDCTFSDLRDGMGTHEPARDILIAGCTFRDSGIGITLWLTTAARVERCDFFGGREGIEIQQYSEATVSNCRFSVARYAIVITLYSSVALHDNVVLGSVVSLSGIDMVSIQASGNVFGPGSYATTEFGLGIPTLNGNHILKGGGPSVKLGGYSRPPLASFDFTGNYWGTTSADSIAAWIHDHNDDPAIQAYVLFEPFSTVPLPVQQKTLGGIKGMFR